MNQEIQTRVIKVIAKARNMPESSIQLDQRIQDICPHSLDLVDMFFEFENEFNINISDEDALKLQTVQDIVMGIEKITTKTVEKV